MAEERYRWGKGLWSSTAWWIVTLYSLPFALYTLLYVYGDYDLYKWVSIDGGFHIRDNLRLWQLHATGALLFIIIGPFQFNASFRSKHSVAHKRMGYTFALCIVVVALSGSSPIMLKASKLGPIAKSMGPFMSVATLLSLAISFACARTKRFQSHRRWILRSAAIGYSVMYTGTLPGLIQLCLGVSDAEALDYSFPLSLALNSILPEVYIQVYLTQPDTLIPAHKVDNSLDTVKPLVLHEPKPLS